jgi:hypothetical protein
MKVRKVEPNNRRKVFELVAGRRSFVFPYGKCEPQPGSDDPVVKVYADPEIGREGFTYVLKSGAEGTVHMDHVLEYNQDPEHLKNLALYRLTLEAQRRVEASPLANREISRRLGTSMSQLYRLLDQTNYSKSIGKLLALLEVLDCEVEITVRDRKPESVAS